MPVDFQFCFSVFMFLVCSLWFLSVAEGECEKDGFSVDLLQATECSETYNDGLDCVPLPRGWQRHEGIINDRVIWFLKIINKTLCFSIMYHYNRAQWCEQFLQVGWLDWASIWLGLAPCHPSTSASSVFMMLYM